MYQRIDPDGHNQLSLDEIKDFMRNDKAVKKKDGYITTPSGHKHMQQITEGCNMLIIYRGDTRDP